MAEPPKQDGKMPIPDIEAPKAQAQPPKPPPRPPNPVLRAMGIPNFRFRLPSRNWMIFLTIVASWTAAVTYDRRQKKANQKKWCDLVAHISQQTLSVSQMPRKLTVYLAAAPGDSIGPSRQYFKQYVKPVLVAAAMDYDVIEGRKEGDVRYGTAEQIRRLRRKQGERGTTEPDTDVESAVDQMRERLQLLSEPGPRGDLVLGRHTWKEYIVGIHEGWLGPLDAPLEPEAVIPLIPSPAQPSPAEAQQASESLTEEEKTPEKQDDKPEETKEEKPEEEKKRVYPPPTYLPISAYSSAPISPHIPSNFEPSQPIHQQHLLGFLKTPQRIYHYLNQRKLADDIGRTTAATVLAAHRPYRHDESFASSSTANLDDPSPANSAEVAQTRQAWEQQSVLIEEEAVWHKSVRAPPASGDMASKIWTADVVLDPRIAERMRRFELEPEELERAERIGSGTEKSRFIPPEKQDDKIIIGNLEDD